MRPEDANRVVGRFTAAFPRPPLDAPTLAVWFDHIEKLASIDTALSACKILERTSKRQPNIADFHEAYKEAAHSTPNRLLGKPDCGICDDGFIAVGCGGINGCTQPFCSVLPCPNECKPMSPAERQQRREAGDRAFKAAARDARFDVKLPDLSIPPDTRVSSQDRREAEEEPF